MEESPRLLRPPRLSLAPRAARPRFALGSTLLHRVLLDTCDSCMPKREGEVVAHGPAPRAKRFLLTICEYFVLKPLNEHLLFNALPTIF